MATDYDYSRYTPIDNTGSNYDIFRSAYKNIRFGLTTTTKMTISEADQANLPGLSYRLYGDTSLWRILLRFNGISDAIQDVYPGLVLNVPDKASIINYLSRQQANRQLTFNI